MKYPFGISDYRQDVTVLGLVQDIEKNNNHFLHFFWNLNYTCIATVYLCFPIVRLYIYIIYIYIFIALKSEIS